MELKALLDEMVRHGASDLHLAAGVPPVLRENGNLLALGAEEEGANAFPILTESDLRGFVTQLRAWLPDWDGRRTPILKLDGMYFRIAMLSEIGIPAISIRLIPLRIPNMVDLFREEHPLYEMLGLRRGLIVVAGPAGSGKSTTVMSMIEEINRTRSERICVIGLEYPIQSKLSLVTQSYHGNDFETMDEAVKRVGAMDPDIVVMIEPVDEAGIMGALRFAVTGHLVFLTVHADSTGEAIEEILLMAQSQAVRARKYLADSLHAVVAQRLLRRSPEQGRVPIHEILMATPWVKERIRRGEVDFKDIIEDGKGKEMLSFDGSIVDLLDRGRISPETAMEHMQNMRYRREGF